MQRDHPRSHEENAGALRFPEDGVERVYRSPREVLVAQSIAEVRAALDTAGAAVSRGMHAAGMLAYEAAPAFDPAFAVHAPGEFPLLWLGIYAGAEFERPAPPMAVSPPGPWRAAVNAAAYTAIIARIREHIAAGDTYQVNYTFPLDAIFAGDALAWYRRLAAAQASPHGAFLDLGRYQVVSASPELFFSLDGEVLTTRPMKGTRPRGRWAAEDDRLAAELAASEKDRAENIMIVDMLRNDMGRISAPGSVDVTARFAVERYETVWQMTSTIVSRTAAAVPEILAVLFPSGSVTGAPKIETMKLIRRYEARPRGVYCGAIGWWEPGRRARFSVPIRTATIDTVRGTVTYPVGSGITWDSAHAAEYQECRDKAAVLEYVRPDFDLLETMLAEKSGVFLMEEHLERLEASACYFGVYLDKAAIARSLEERSHADSPPCALRLLVARDGSHRIETRPLPPPALVRIGFAKEPVDSRDVFLFHKTTLRGVYEAARAGRPDCTDVLLWNERGEITESSIANVVLCIGGRLLTPKVDAGLLAGVFRRHLLARGDIQEARLCKEDVSRAEKIYLINSVRKWSEAEWCGDS